MLIHPAQGWRDEGGPTLGHRPKRWSNPERVESNPQARPQRRLLRIESARWAATVCEYAIKSAAVQIQKGETLKQMPHLRSLSIEVLFVVRVGGGVNRNTLHDLQAVPFQSDDLFGVIRQETHFADTKIY